MTRYICLVQHVSHSYIKRVALLLMIFATHMSVLIGLIYRL